MNGPPLNSEGVSLQQEQQSSQEQQTTESKQQNSDEEEWSGTVECAAVLERSKSERLTRTDEDRRRRTIIVEKKNGTYGFTLQSYGIHYKREQEIEMVTYVDYVEYDGPAFKAGMREGDVIISINGQEMDRADHKTLVNFIKHCDTRMRMVVSFEDCVRKVELHMRYIELQRALQSRLGELERLCERERSILMGRWKTHSLPARKRTPNNNELGGNDPNRSSPSSSFNSSTIQCCRPTNSTEHLFLYSVLSDGRPFLIPRNAACLVAVGPPRSRSDHHYIVSKTSLQSGPSNSITRINNYRQTNGTPSKSKSHKSSCGTQEKHQSSHQNNLCVACISSMTHLRNQQQSDNTSLDAYDLASPCCDPNCVPSRRRREKQRKARNEQQHVQQKPPLGPSGHSSLHSMTSTDMSTVTESVASCSTSLSTDTLYWEHSNAANRGPLEYSKPKSWDNLTTRAFGGYGFGYGYLDCTKTQSAERPNNNNKGIHRSNCGKIVTTGPVQSRRTIIGPSPSVESYGNTSNNSSRIFQTTKSIDNLLLPTSNCACLEDHSIPKTGHRFPVTFVKLDKHKDERSFNDMSGNHIHHNIRHRKVSNSEGKIRNVDHSEATRL